MRILFITPSYKPAFIYGGTTVVVSELAEELVRQGHDVTVYTTTANGREELEVEEGLEQLVSGVRVIYYKRITKDHTHISPPLFRSLWKTVKSFDVVHIHSWWSILVIVSAWICIRKGVKPVLSPHGMLSGYTLQTQNSFVKKIIHWVVGKRLLQHSYLHACTMHEWKECTIIYPKWQGFVASNLIRLPDISPNQIPKQEHDKYEIAFLSRIDHKKGLDILFKALAKVKFPYILNIGGSGEESFVLQLKKLAIQYNIDANIIWKGWKSGRDKFDFLSANDLFVLPSRSENFAIVVIEALASGIPVLLSDQVGISDYVEEKGLGWLCGSENVDELAASLTKSWKERDKRKQISKIAPLSVFKDFEPSHLTSLYIDFYKKKYGTAYERKFNILHVNASYKPAYIYGGPTISVSGLCEALSKKQNVEVYTTTANGRTEIDVEPGSVQRVDGVKVIYFERLTKDHSHFSPSHAYHLMKHLKEFDIIHIHAWWNTVSIISCFIAIVLGVPIVFSPRGTLSRYSFKHKNALLKRLAFLPSKLMLKKAVFHVTSIKEKHDLTNIVKPRAIHSVPNFVKLAEGRSNVKLALIPQVSPETLKLIFLSRIDEKKGLELLFDTLAQLKTDWILSIAGLGKKEYMDALRQLAVMHQIDDKIHWLGFLDHQQKFPALKQHDLFILPSYDENFANVVIESLSVGTPVMISKNVGLADVIEREHLGWTFLRDKESLIEKLNYVIKHPSELQDIRKRAPGIIKKQFSEPALLKQYIEMYAEAIDNG